MVCCFFESAEDDEAVLEAPILGRSVNRAARMVRGLDPGVG